MGDEVGEPRLRAKDGGKDTRCFLSPRRKCGLFVAIPVCLGGSLLLVFILCGLPALMLAAVGMNGGEPRRVVLAPAIFPGPRTTGDQDGLRAFGKGIKGDTVFVETGDDSAEEEIGRATSGPVTGGEGGDVQPVATWGEGGGVGSFVPVLLTAISAGTADIVAETRRFVSSSRSFCVSGALTGAAASLLICLGGCGLAASTMGGAVVPGALSTFAVGKKDPFSAEADTRRFLSSSFCA